jgi:glutaredoxin-related protein
MKTETNSVPQLRITDAASFDLRDRSQWKELDDLIDLKFQAFVEFKDADAYKGLQRGEFPNNLYQLLDEFIIEQARVIGVRVLFNDHVRAVIYEWGQRPESCSILWRRFAKNIQAGFDRDLFVLTDPRLPRGRQEMIDELKQLRRVLRSKKAADIEWDMALHTSNLRRELQQFADWRLASNITKFVEFVQDNELAFKGWLTGVGKKVTNAEFVNLFLAYCHRYRSPESTRQAIQKLHKPKRRNAVRA